jgi:arsenate reductase
MNTVIFACVHNAGRSQMAAAFFNALVDLDKARAISAGTQPGERVHPEVLTAMAEVGLDLSGAKPQRLTDELSQGARWLITLGCGEACPHVPGLKRDDWPLEDPKGRPVAQVRRIRDEVALRVARFVEREGWSRSGRHVTVRAATAADLPAVLRLLGAASLPLEGVEAHFGDFLVAEVDGQVSAAGGLEVYGDAALLRSVVVSPTSRGLGLGRRLTEALLEHAVKRGAPSLYLLTTTAEDYFPRLGFVRTTRDALPPALHASEELRGACPQSAVVMHRRP